MKKWLLMLAIVIGSVSFANPSSGGHGGSENPQRSVLEEGNETRYGHTCYAKGKKGFQTYTYSGNGLTEFQARVDALQNCYDDDAFFCAHSRCD